MSAWTSFWFWLTILSIIGFITVFVTIQAVTNYQPPLWVWYIYGLSLALLVVGFILFCFESAQHYRVRGELEGNLKCSSNPVPGTDNVACVQRFVVERAPTMKMQPAPKIEMVMTAPQMVAPPPKKAPCPPVQVEEAFGAATLPLPVASPTK